MGRIKIFNKKNYSVMCPRCGKFLMKTDRDNTNVIKIACKNCNKWIWCLPVTEDYIVKDIPERQTGSGMRFF